MNAIGYQRNGVTVSKKYFQYFLPTVLTAMANNLAMIVDSVVAGNFMGGKALAAINLISPISQLYFSLTILFGLGASTIISIAKGRRDGKYANKVFTASMFYVACFCVVLMGVQLPLADNISRLLTGDEAVRDLLYAYYVPFICGTPLNLFMLCLVHIIRTDGRQNFSSAIVIIANVINLGMDFVYMGPCGMGIAGSAIATITGYGVGLALALSHFFRKSCSIKLDLKLFRSGKEFGALSGELFTVGLSGALGTLLIVVKLQVMNSVILSSAGSAGIVAYSLCSSSSIFISMFITGASQAMMPIIGVCLGEKDYDGVRYAFKRAFTLLLISSVVIMIIVGCIPAQICSAFGVTDAESIAEAIPALRINSIAFPFQSVSFLLLYYFMSVKRKAISVTISVVNSVLIQIPAVYLFAFLWGTTGVWISLVTAQAGTVVVAVVMAAVVKARSGGRYTDLYLVDKSDKDQVLALSFKGTVANAVGVSDYIAKFLLANGIDAAAANKAAIIAEETAVSIDARNKRKADIDINIRITDGETLVCFRDNGVPFDPAESDEKSDAEVLSGTDLVRIISKDIKYSRVLGFNSTIVSI